MTTLLLPPPIQIQPLPPVEIQPPTVTDDDIANWLSESINTTSALSASSLPVVQESEQVTIPEVGCLTRVVVKGAETGEVLHVSYS